MADNQAEMPVGTLAQEAEPSETTKTTETPASEQPKVELEVDTDEQEELDAKTGDEDADEDDEGEKKPKKASGSARLKARLAAAEAELARVRQFVPVQSDGAELDKAIAAKLGPEPKESDFPDFLAYERKANAYETARMLLRAEFAEQAERSREQIKAEADAAREAHDARVKEARKILPDYDTKVRSADFSRLNPDVAKMCVESNKSATIAYYLASNPKVLDELSRMDAVSAARRIGRIEASVRLPKPETSTRAPAPPAKLPGGGAPPAKRAEEALSMKDYAAIRAAELGWK